MRPLAILGLGIVAIDAACGPSSANEATAPNPIASGTDVDPYCHDATLPGAATPALGFCSDGSHRAPTAAPQAPRLVWQRKMATLGAFLVDGQQVIHSSNGTVFPNGPTHPSAAKYGSLSFIDRDGNLVGRELQETGFVVGLRTPAGALVGTMTPANVTVARSWDIAASASADGEVDVVHPNRGAMSSSIGWIERVDLHGSVWIAATGCRPVNEDVSCPTSTIRTQDGGAASACGSVPAPNVLVNVFDRMGTATASVRVPAVSIASNLAQLPTGELALVTSDETSMVLWTLRGADVVSRTRLAGMGPANLAVARDRTLVVRTSKELFAFAPTAPEATLRFRVPAALDDIDEPMGGVTTTPLFVDADSTIVTWGNDVEARSLADGKLRWAFAAPPQESFTYVTAAGRGALYALSTDGTLTLLSDR